ncbi:MAG: hypothetical protein Q9217_002295 [Psora testacea]
MDEARESEASKDERLEDGYHDTGNDQLAPLPNLIRSDTIGEDEVSRLKNLATEVRDQQDLERDINRHADQLLTEHADERDQKRLEKTCEKKDRLQSQIHKLRERRGRSTGSAAATRQSADISHLEAQFLTLETELDQIQERIKQRRSDSGQYGEPREAVMGNRRLPNETQREFLIRTGKITPFSKMPGRALNHSDSTLQDVLLDAEEAAKVAPTTSDPLEETMSHRKLLQPGFMCAVEEDRDIDMPDALIRPKKRRRLPIRQATADIQMRDCQDTQDANGEAGSIASSDQHDSTFEPQMNDGQLAALGESEEDADDGFGSTTFRETSPQLRRGRRVPQSAKSSSPEEDLTGLDDGNERLYQKRLRNWIDRRRTARQKAAQDVSRNGQTKESMISSERVDDANHVNAIPPFDDEWHIPHPVRPDTNFEGGLNIPGDVYPALFDYQKTGVQWLWELYSQQVGGIVGDEMGLGKTIQVIAFLAGLHYSKMITKPIIVVAPATVMKQWVNEFHTWWPPFRVSILHTSGSGMIDLGREAQGEDEMLSCLPSTSNRKPLTKSQKSAKRIVDRVVQGGHVLVTTYSGLQSYAELLIPVAWEYAILDEGHKIRNPNTAITIYCKELRTANRVILSGTPMQNNLVELWSLFDFVFPMRLGTLVNFRQQFEIPIRQGGYANASNLQVQTAMKCAETLKDTISPYLLQRFKADVASDLPKKSEQVLFCKLTKFQRGAYEEFLASDDLKAIMNGKRQILYGVDILRKICNHPDLVEHKTLSIQPGYNYGSGAKSGKMQVVKALLELWKEQGHKTLLFAQHRIMLDILEKFIKTMDGVKYRRMDGTTAIRTRQDLVDEFNNNEDAHVFLLTTKVGGLGVNLTGADRVIIYDPDWNPSTDVQARERAWRLGQKREVMIYRLMTAGTIEEKIYHRQLFKQFLINKILRDPKKRQTFQMKDLHDLFTLGGANAPSTETGELFRGTEVQFANGDASLEPTPVNDVSRTDSSITANEGETTSSVRSLTGVAHIERFYAEEQNERKAADLLGTNSEARVMESIFARSGVHAALEHDQIINGRKVMTADPEIIEKEAKRVASEAANELRKAGEAAKSVPVGIPTWTGEFGSAGRPPQQQRGFSHGRGGPSSASILAGLQNRLATTNGPNNTSKCSTPGSTAVGSKGADFIKMIRDYLVAHGGAAKTQMLIDHFNRFCKTPEKTAEFKAMLTELAILQKGTRGRGQWVLKDEYK